MYLRINPPNACSIMFTIRDWRSDGKRSISTGGYLGLVGRWLRAALSFRQFNDAID